MNLKSDYHSNGKFYTLDDELGTSHSSISRSNKSEGKSKSSQYSDSIVMSRHILSEETKNNSTAHFHEVGTLSKIGESNPGLTSSNLTETNKSYKIDNLADGDRYKANKQYQFAIDQYFIALKRNSNKEVIFKLSECYVSSV